MMKEKWIYILTPALVLLAAGLWLLIAGARDASAVEQSVVRFHVVANSDSAEDQQIGTGSFCLLSSFFPLAKIGRKRLRLRNKIERSCSRRRSGCFGKTAARRWPWWRSASDFSLPRNTERYPFPPENIRRSASASERQRERISGAYFTPLFALHRRWRRKLPPMKWQHL